MGRGVTEQVEITDPKVARAYAHPARIHILSLLDQRVASLREIADEIRAPLPQTRYHVRQLVSWGFVERVRRPPRRGAIQHLYTARVRPVIQDELWGKLPEIAKRPLIDGLLRHAGAEVDAAVERGGFDRAEAHLTRSALRLDARGWRAVSRELGRTLKRIEHIEQESEARLAADPEVEPELAWAIMFLFERPG
jgi:DNA-binding transcriptional ArsR family regulator